MSAKNSNNDGGLTPRQVAILRIRNMMRWMYMRIFDVRTAPPQDVIDFVVRAFDEDDGGVESILEIPNAQWDSIRNRIRGHRNNLGNLCV